MIKKSLSKKIVFRFEKLTFVGCLCVYKYYIFVFCLKHKPPYSPVFELLRIDLKKEIRELYCLQLKEGGFMKHFKHFLMLAAMLLSGIQVLHSQTMYVRNKSGGQTAYQKDEISKISFQPGDMHIHKVDASIHSHALAQVRYVNFMDLMAGIPMEETADISLKLDLYPNPARGILHLRVNVPLEENAVLEIYTMEGIKVFSGTWMPGKSLMTISISGFSKGMYVCRLALKEGGLTGKFFKH